MDKKEAARIRKQNQRKRDIEKMSQTENVTQSPESVTKMSENVTPNVTSEHPVMKYLIDPDQRKKMEAIVQSLKDHNQLPNVSLGCGKHSLPLDVVGELLEITDAIK